MKNVDNNVYINLETNEIVTNIPNYINCDKEIAHVIALLNSKGYITNASCAGHFDRLIYYESSKPISEKSYFEENKELGLEIIRVTEKEIIYRGLAIESNLYISFEKDYGFTSLPPGFNFEDNHIIRKYFELQDEHENKYTLSELKNIQNDSIEKLYEWSKTLINLNEKERGKNI